MPDAGLGQGTSPRAPRVSSLVNSGFFLQEAARGPASGVGWSERGLDPTRIPTAPKPRPASPSPIGAQDPQPWLDTGLQRSPGALGLSDAGPCVQDLWVRGASLCAGLTLPLLPVKQVFWNPCFIGEGARPPPPPACPLADPPRPSRLLTAESTQARKLLSDLTALGEASLLPCDPLCSETETV